MKEIALTQGKVAMVDDTDYEWLSRWKWYTYRSGNTWYARRAVRKPNGRWSVISMHQTITGIRGVDHADGNGLNNQRKNLRPATQNQNGANRRIGSNNSSGFKGVMWIKSIGKWIARIKANGRQVHLGFYANSEEAALAYDTAAKEMFGEFAKTNF